MSDEDKKMLLSTSSPEGIQIASQITPSRLAGLLIRKGPLPIRHITAQLALEVQGFDQLSLSKQRRLIMAAMEQTDRDNNVVFEKIGWGQWAVRQVDSDFIVTEGSEGNLVSKVGLENGQNGRQNDPQPVSHSDDKKGINVKDLRNQPNLKLGWSKKQSGTIRRESITNKKPNLHNVQVPSESLNSAIVSDSDIEDENNDIDDLIGDSSEEESSEEDDDAIDDSESDELFEFDQDNEDGKSRKRSPPIQFANRVPLRLSPPPNHSNSRRRSSNSNNVSKNTTFNPRNQLFSRSRLNSLDNLDNYIMSSAKNSNGSFSSPPPPPPNAAVAALSGSPLSSWNNNSSNYIHNNLSKSPDSIMAAMSSNRRKSSFNESHIRSTLSASLPKANQSNPNLNPGNGTSYNSNSNSTSNSPNMDSNTANNVSDTDEEDWATMGAEGLRNKPKQEDVEENDTKAAAFALVDLMSV